MAATLDTYVSVKFVADANTPTGSLPYDGRIYYLPPDLMTALGTGSANPGYIDGIRGYMRIAVDGSHEWLMVDLLDAVLRQAILAIPGGAGWVDPAQRLVYRQQAVRLVNLGVTSADVADIEKRLYDAAVANYVASPH
jgi:hypothetical protein